jgi:hypothetical protein
MILTPFVVLAIIAAGLVQAKHAVAWFAICMEHQQARAQKRSISKDTELTLDRSTRLGWLSFRYYRRLSIIIFHENWLIFWLPAVSFLHFLEVTNAIDFRVVFIVLAGCVYFPVQIIEIHLLFVTRKIQKAYLNFNSDSYIPNLPNDHFFK